MGFEVITMWQGLGRTNSVLEGELQLLQMRTTAQHLQNIFQLQIQDGKFSMILVCGDCPLHLLKDKAQNRKKNKTHYILRLRKAMHLKNNSN